MEDFIVLSLKDSETKRIARVIQNSTSQKIIEYLSERVATETEISEELGIPLSTVDYNIKHLMRANLVKADEFHYSEKGKEVNHYSLTKKHIIITPETDVVKSKLGSLVAAIGVIIAGTAILRGSHQTPRTLKQASVGLMESTTPSPQTWHWFLIGGLVSVAVYIICREITRKWLR